MLCHLLVIGIDVAKTSKSEEHCIYTTAGVDHTDSGQSADYLPLMFIKLFCTHTFHLSVTSHP